MIALVRLIRERAARKRLNGVLDRAGWPRAHRDIFSGTVSVLETKR